MVAHWRRVSLALAVVSLLGACPSTPDDPVVVGDTGRVRFSDGSPAAGAHVRITGLPDQTTGADGTFSLAGAPATYDAAVAWANYGLVYVGLTRRDPTLTLTATLFSLTSGTVTGTVAGLDTVNNEALVALAAQDGGCSIPTGGAYTLAPRWHGSSPLSATLHLLEFTRDTRLVPNGFTGHARAAVTVADGGTTTQGLTLGAVTSRALNVSTDATNATLALWVSWPEGGVTRIGAGAPGATSATLATAEISGATWGVLASHGSAPQEFAWRRGIVAGSSPSAMTMPTGAALTAPADAATGVGLSTDFTWSGLAGGVHLVRFNSTAAGAPMVGVVTAGTTARIPDITWSGGPALPANTLFTVSLRGVGPFASVDEAAGDPGMVTAHPTYWDSAFANRLPSFDGYASADVRTFTTAP